MPKHTHFLSSTSHFPTTAYLQCISEKINKGSVVPAKSSGYYFNYFLNIRRLLHRAEPETHSDTERQITRVHGAFKQEENFWEGLAVASSYRSREGGDGGPKGDKANKASSEGPSAYEDSRTSRANPSQPIGVRCFGRTRPLPRGNARFSIDHPEGASWAPRFLVRPRHPISASFRQSAPAKCSAHAQLGRATQSPLSFLPPRSTFRATESRRRSFLPTINADC